MMIRSLGVHDLKIAVVVFGNISEIVQIHGTPPHFFSDKIPDKKRSLIPSEISDLD